MTKQDSRTPPVDPREPLWLSIVTVLFCLAEGALITLVLLDFRASLFALTAWLGERTAELSALTVERLGFPLLVDNLWGVPVPFSVEQVWLVAVVTTAVFTLLGALILARNATRAALEATYTSSGSYRRRKAETLERLDHMLS